MSASNSTNGRSLRFAFLIRVSTEKQDQQGESLRIQKADNTRDVATLGGRIVAQYGGQEHATPGWEHAEVDRLLADAAKGRLDAVIVNKSDRWSRDNAKSEEGLEVFARGGVRFFVRTREYNLHDEDDRFSIGIDVLIGQRTARSYARRALRSRIARAERGLPSSSGRLPFGRVFVWANKQRMNGTWEIDSEAKALIEDVARRYLGGEPLKKLAREHGLKYWHLRHTLVERCSDTWAQEFHSDKLNVHESVPTKVPRLLDDGTIKAVRARLAAGNTYIRKGGRKVNDYLLSGFIFCEACGCNLCGRIDRHGKTYYEHSYAARQVRCPLSPRPRVQARRLESEVVRELVDMFGNPAAIERAFRASQPDREKEQKRKVVAEAKLTAVTKKRVNVLDAVADGLFTRDQVRAKLAEIEADEAHWREELDRVNELLADAPDEAALDAYLEWRDERFNDLRRASVDQVNEALAASGSPSRVKWRDGPRFEVIDRNSNMVLDGSNNVCTFVGMCTPEGMADQRRLVEAVFCRPVNGKPAGIYVFPEGEHLHYRRKNKRWGFTLRGLLPFEKVVMGGGR
jgi:DNA invertase Pin-like site-specific DNA recombinase